MAKTAKGTIRCDNIDHAHVQRNTCSNSGEIDGAPPRDGDVRLLQQVADHLELFDGRDWSAGGVVEELLKRSVRVRIESKSQVSVELPFRLVIAAAVPKGDRQQFMVEKLVELGCTELWPVTYQR